MLGINRGSGGFNRLFRFYENINPRGVYRLSFGPDLRLRGNSASERIFFHYVRQQVSMGFNRNNQRGVDFGRRELPVLS